MTPFSCDTSVVLGSATFDGSTIFAKNSDRSANEAQPLTHVPRATHALGSTVRCQYIEIPQVEQTWEVIGSRPCWLWGFEMGVNEWGVAIGNEAVHTREPNADRGLIGMDILRLALERARNDKEAVAVICDLIEQYGQGGSCEEHSYRTYHNSYIVADPEMAWIVETAGHRWIVQRVADRAAIGNMLTIGNSWDAASPGLVEHAQERGWSQGQFDFAAAYQDPEADLAPRACRLERSRAMLGGYRNPIDVGFMMGLLRDHDGRGLPTTGEPLPTLCMHARPGFTGETAAAMVAHLRPEKPRELTATVWTAFGSPCLSIFRPVYPFAVGLPAVLDIGASRFDPDSPWWMFERLQRIVAAEPTLAIGVREHLAPTQMQIFLMAEGAESLAADLLEAGNREHALATLRKLVDDTTEKAITAARYELRRLTERTHPRPESEMVSFWDEMNRQAGILVPSLS